MNLARKLRKYVRRSRRESENDRLFLLKRLPPKSVGCEVGVWKGEFSRQILETVQPHLLYLVDPWTFQPQYPGSWYGGSLARTQADMDQIHDSVSREFRHCDNIRIIRKKTEDLGDEIEDHSLDWVYIDGNHQYEYVLEDLKMYYRKVAPGGIISGDDFDRGQEPYPITRAVHEFLEQGTCELLWVKHHQFYLRKTS